MAKGGGISKIFVWALLGLLFVGLAGFGVGSFGGRVNSVASVGETDVDARSYGRALQEALRRQTELTGTRPTFAEAQAQGLDRAVLRDLLAEAALTEAARRAGVSASDDQISAEILRIPAFQGADGTFDPDAYRFAVDRAGFSVAEFEEQVRNDIARQLFSEALARGVQPQPGYADAILRFAGEERAISYALLSEADLDPAPSAPTEAEARAFWEDNPDLFTLPERKAITYAWLTPAMLASTVEIEESALREAYEARTAEYRRPERRFAERLSFPDEAAAQAAADAIAAGETTFDALLDDRDLTPADIDLGAVTRTDLGAAADGVFALDDPGVAGPLPSPVGPALYRVNAILEAQETSFEEARASLRDELALQRASAIIEDEAEPLEDLLAGGATLEELAEESAMQLGSTAWDGPSAEGILAYDAFNRAAAEVSATDFPEILALDGGGIFALRLDEVLPPDLQPFDEVAERATRLAADAAVTAALSEAATRYADRLAAGESFEDLGLTAARRTGLTRGGRPGDLPAGAVAAIFETEADATAVVADAGRAAVFRVDRVAPPDPDAEGTQALRSAIERDAAQSMAEEALRAVAADLEARVGISLDQAALNAVHGTLQ